MTSNLFGVGIDGLDVSQFLAGARALFVLLTVALAIATRGRDSRRIAWIVLGAGIAGHFLAWFATMFPLANAYGANGSMDRENHLGWANMVALGFSPLRTFQVDHLHFEPLWPLLVAMASGFEIENVPLVFQWAPLIVGILVLIAVRFVWRRASWDDAGVEASFAAIGALLLIAVPGDSEGPFRDPWTLTFLLKPNHALGLVLAPLAALALARAHDLRSRLFAGFVLQLVGWAFVIHMALVVAGFAVFVALAWLLRSPDRRNDLLDTGVTVGVNLALVSPYLLMLLLAYPMFDGRAFNSLPPFSERPLEAPLRLGLFFALSAYAAWETYRSGDRLGRILACQWLTAHLIWQLFPLLGIVGQAREQDEVFYWCRFWTGLFAAVGVFRLVRCGLANWGLAKAAAAALVLVLPSLIPAWRNPETMDQYFLAARKPLPDWIAQPMRYVRDNTDVNAVFLGDRHYARWIAAYGGRRVLMADSLNAPRDATRRAKIETAILNQGEDALVREGMSSYGLRYVLATSVRAPGSLRVEIDKLRLDPGLEPVFDRVFADREVVIFKIRPRPFPAS